MSRRNLEKTQPRPLKADAMFSRKCPECGGYHIVEPGVILRRRGKEAR